MRHVPWPVKSNMDNDKKTFDFEDLDKHLEKCEKWEEAYPKLIDFVRYALHESMLPHHFHPSDQQWRANRVTCAAQELLNELGEPQDEPKNYTLVFREEYWDKNRHRDQLTVWEEIQLHLYTHASIWMIAGLIALGATLMSLN